MTCKHVYEGALVGVATHPGCPWCTIESLQSRLDTYRRAAVYRDNGYDVCRFCKHRAHMGEEIPHDDYCPLVVERHEPVMGFPAESEAEELRRKNSFFPPLMPKSE